jgi:hypothetical protein
MNPRFTRHKTSASPRYDRTRCECRNSTWKSTTENTREKQDAEWIGRSIDRIRVRARVPLLVVSVGWMYPRGYRPVVSRPGRFTSESKLKLNLPPSRVMCRAVCDATCPSFRRDLFFGWLFRGRSRVLCVWVYSVEEKACVCPAADFAGTPVPLNLARLPRPSQTVKLFMS